MFVVVEAGGVQSPYVPGRFRFRKVDPVQKVLPVVHVTPESRQSEPDHSHRGNSAFIRAYEAMDTMRQAGRSVILAEDVMTSPAIGLTSEATLLQAQTLFQQHRFRHVPITNDQDHVVGIVSDRDIWRAVADPGLYRLSTAIDPARTAVFPVMSQPVLVAKPETEVRSIARVMFEEHIGAMPIVSKPGRLLGIMTRSDILRVLISHPDFDHWV